MVDNVVIDWHSGANSASLKPGIILGDKDGNPVLFDNGKDVRYYLSVGAILTVENGAEVKVGDVVAKFRAKAQDQGYYRRSAAGSRVV